MQGDPPLGRTASVVELNGGLVDGGADLLD